MGEASYDPDVPWERVLVVSGRIERCLRERGLVTLREVAEAARGKQLLEQRGFGLHSLWQLRFGLKALETEKASGTGRAVKECGAVLDDGVIASLQARRPDLLEVTWYEALFDVPARVATHLTLARAVTVRDALEIATARPRRRAKNFGRTSLAQLRAALRDFIERESSSSLADAATVAHPAGGATGGGPALRELMREALESVAAPQREAFVARYVEHRTLEDVGRRLGVTRERARQIASRQLDRARRRLGRRALEALGPVIERLDANGIVHLSDLKDVCGDADVATIVFCLRLAMIDDVRVYRDEFIVRSTCKDVDRVLAAIRAALRWRNRSHATADEALSKIHAVTGWRPSLPCVRRLMAPSGGVARSGDGSDPPDLPEPVPSFVQRRVARLAAIVRDAGRPMREWEIAACYLEATGGYKVFEAGARSGPSPSVPSWIHVEALIKSHMCRFEDIYRIGPATYAHVDCLPVEPALLSWAVEWCVDWLRGRTAATSTSVLAAELARHRPSTRRIAADLLQSALAKHPEIVLRHRSLVVHGPSLDHHATKLQDSIEVVLWCASRPLSARDVGAALRYSRTTFREISVRKALRASPHVLELNDRCFVHADRIGLAPGERAALVEAALRLLPEDGSEISIFALLDALDVAPAFGDLVTPGHEAEVFRALLVKDPRFG